MKKMTRKQADNFLYELWEDGIIPSNFTEDHSSYEDVIEHLLNFGEVFWEEIEL